MRGVANEKMAKKLIIVESPTKTKTIAKYLGKEYRILASKGHLRDLPKSRFGVDIENNFEPQYINVRGKAKTINELKKAAKEADEVLLAPDPDREGEAIAWHLRDLLGLSPNEKNRITFQEITKKGIEEGIAHPRTINSNLVDAQQARRVMDRIVGYKISPILWKKVRSGLSAGRVQSVALRLIVDREREIRAFVPQEYWTVHAHFQKNGISFLADWYGTYAADGTVEKGTLSDEQAAQRILEGLDSAYLLVRQEQKRRSRKPYAPFTTSTLQQEASRRLGFSTSKTMSVAQQLYEGVALPKEGHVGLITYMRTDSTRLSAQFQSEASAYITRVFGAEYATRGVGYGGARNAQDAHEAVRPTSLLHNPASLEGALTKDQFRLYQLIWQRAVASQMKPARYLATSLRLQNGKQEFRATGNKPLFDGFQKVWSLKDTTTLLPELIEGETLLSNKKEKQQHFTQAPARYSEASLVATLEKNGIGRPSTYSATIQSILKRRYVVLEKKQFVPTELGENVTDFLVQNFPDIINEKFTAKMEARLDDVAEGEQAWRALLSNFYQVFSKDLQSAQSDTASYRVAERKTGEKCPECGKDLVVKHGRNGDFIGCSGFPDCKFTKNIVITTGIRCPKCQKGEIVEKVSKRGKIFYSCSAYPACDWASWDKPTGEICERCGDLMVRRKNRREDRTYCHNESCENH